MNGFRLAAGSTTALLGALEDITAVAPYSVQLSKVVVILKVECNYSIASIRSEYIRHPSKNDESRRIRCQV